MATYLGDPTAKYQGRLSLNPLAHLDPMGTLMLFIAGFGWGRPVPFNMSHLRNPRVDAALIACAGPLANLLLAFLFAVPYRYLYFSDIEPSVAPRLLTNLFQFMGVMINLNLVLMIFNLLPIPPLDGSKIFSLILPGDALYRLYRYRNLGYGILILLVFSGSLFGVNILSTYILQPIVGFFWDLVLFSS